MVYALWVLRVCEPNDNRQDLIAAFRRPWPCDVQPVDVARVDGLDDLPPRPFVFVADRPVERFQFPVQDLGRPFPVLGGGVRRRV